MTSILIIWGIGVVVTIPSVHHILIYISRLVTSILWRRIVVCIPSCTWIVTSMVTNFFALRWMSRRTFSLSFVSLLLICIRTVWISHVRIHHWMCRWSRWKSIWRHRVTWHWRMRRRKHIHREVDVDTCVSRIRVTWMFSCTVTFDIGWGFHRIWSYVFCFLFSHRRNWGHGRHIIRMIRPMVRHRIFVRLVV